MYSPTLGSFLSRDPQPQLGEPDILFDNNWFGDWLTLMRNSYGYASSNPVNRIDPTGLADKPKEPALPSGGWICSPGGSNQTPGHFSFHETFHGECVSCSEDCKIKVMAYRCFNQSVAPGNDSDPKNFFTVFNVQFTRTHRKCGDKALPDETSYWGGCRLYPGRLIFPGGPLSDAVIEYVKGLKSCDEFDLGKMCDVVKKVAPPNTITPSPK